MVLGEHEELRLNVTVTNDKDSAYEAQLFVVHQPSVSYIAASKGSAICNRFNATIVSCTLGNPLRRDGSAQVVLRFDPSGLEDSAPLLSFSIFANSTSKQIIQRQVTELEVRVVKRAEISIKGWAKPEQSFYGGEVRGESAMQYFEDVGTLVEHTYQIYNDGPWRAPQLEVNIMWPYQVANDKPQGKWLLYLEQVPQVESTNGGDCEYQSDIFNPLKLKQKPRELYEQQHIGETATASRLRANKTLLLMGESSERTAERTNRVKRDRAMIIRPEKLTDDKGKESNIVHMVCI